VDLSRLTRAICQVHSRRQKCAEVSQVCSKHPEVVEAARTYLRARNPGFEEDDPEGFAADTDARARDWLLDEATPAEAIAKEIEALTAALDVLKEGAQ